MKQLVFIFTLLLLIATKSIVAQTTITLPAACNTCGPSPTTNGTAIVSAYGGAGCTGSGTITGTMTAGTAVSGVTMTLYANVTQVGTYSLLAAANGVTFSGSGTFSATGCQVITLTASGTPSTAGSFSYTTNTTPSTTMSSTVAPATFPSTNGTAIVSAYGGVGCTGSGAIAGTMTQGTVVSGVTMTLYANVTQVGTYSLSAVANGVTFSGSGTFTTTGCQAITFTASGTPSAAGTFSYATNTTPSTTVSATVNVSVPSNPVGAGSFSGKTCFDIALGNDNTNSCGSLSARIATQANFTQVATHTQSYTFTPSGTVSNVRFVYINTNGSPVTAISGNNTGNNISTPVIATVNYVTTNIPFMGLTNSNPHTVDIYVIYNDGATNNGTDRQLKLTANVKDCACCVAKVSATVWKVFLCHNLGANTSLDPHDMTQTNAWGLQGGYIQWGRRGPNTTGDSRVDWVSAANTANFGAAPTGSTAGTANSAAIGGWTTSTAADFSWRTAGGAKTANDPCPSGFRVPTITEWSDVNSNNTVSRSGAWTNSVTYYNSALHYGPNASTKLLTLPAAGARNIDGSLYGRGSDGLYWSSTEGGSPLALYMYFNSSTVMNAATNRAAGFSLRCIAE